MPIYSKWRITPDILDLCGFLKDRNGYKLPDSDFSLTDKFYPCWFDKMIWPQDVERYKNNSLKYLHELQNMVYIFTGQELKHRL